MSTNSTFRRVNWFTLIICLFSLVFGSFVMMQNRAKAQAATIPTITEFPVPTSKSFLSSIASGPAGNLWFTEFYGNNIGRITPSGVVTEFPIPTSKSSPCGITLGHDGNLWFTEGTNKIGRITPSGVITEFSLPTSNSYPLGITSGPDGNLWFTDDGGNSVGRITPSGVITEFPLPTGHSSVFAITPGTDGNLWFAEDFNNSIGRITPSGVITEFPLPNVPYGITSGPDGNLWFTEDSGSNIGRITPSGVITEFPAPSRSFSITSGIDGNLWFAEGNNNIGRITPNGVVTEFSTASSSSYTIAITSGADGNLWFADEGTNSIGRVNIAPTTPPTVTNASFTGTEGQTGLGTVHAKSASNSKLTLTATGLPSFASFKDNGDSMGTVTYNPKAGNAGTYTFSVTASDGSQTGTGTVTLTIAKAVQRNKLVVIVQGLDSLLSSGNVAGNNNNGYGTVSGFGTIVANLQKTAEFKTNTQFMAFSYKGTQNHTDGKPLIYGCQDTYANPIMLDESNLKAQISLYLTKHPNTDVYIFSHSLGGVVAFAYVADLVENNQHSLSLGGGSVLKGVAIADSPLGGIIHDSGYLDSIVYKALRCANAPTLPKMVTIADLANIRTDIPWKTSFEGETASIYYSILNKGKGTYITNQQVGQNAVNLGLRLVIVGNEYDLLWHPNVCLLGSNFGNTEFMVETGKGIKNDGALYARSFKSGSLNPLECLPTTLSKTLGHHMDVLSDVVSKSDVSTLVWEVFTDRKVDKLTPVTISHKA